MADCKCPALKKPIDTPALGGFQSNWKESPHSSAPVRRNGGKSARPFEEVVFSPSFGIPVSSACSPTVSAQRAKIVAAVAAHILRTVTLCWAVHYMLYRH